MKLDDYVKDFAMNNPLTNQGPDEDEQVTTGGTEDEKNVKPKRNVNTVDENEELQVTDDSSDTVGSDDTTGNVFVSDGNGDIVVRTNELLGEK